MYTCRVHESLFLCNFCLLIRKLILKVLQSVYSPDPTALVTQEETVVIQVWTC